MKKAYIILVHKNPEQVYNLIKRLDDDNSSFWVHIDKKVKIDLFNQLSYFGNKIIFTGREDGRWGRFGIVKATINALRKIRESNQNFDRIILLSGQDYPLKTNAYINNFLETSPKSVFMATFSALPYANWDNGGLDRIYNYYFGLEKNYLYLNKAVNILKRFIPFLKKEIPYNLTVYVGSQWWIMDMYALHYILDYLDSHERFIKFFRYSLLSDEMFFQTILLNSTDEKILNSIENDNKRFISIPTEEIHPITLTKDNLETLLASNALFARKFDINLDAEIIPLLNQHIT